MTHLGTHYIIEFYGCNSESLKRAKECETIFAQAAKEGNFTVVDEHYHEFKPWGVSGVTVLSESHMSVHTWPEHGYAAIDLFYCGGVVYPEKAIAHLQTHFKPTHVESTLHKRGCPEKLALYLPAEQSEVGTPNPKSTDAPYINADGVFVSQRLKADQIP